MMAVKGGDCSHEEVDELLAVTAVPVEDSGLDLDLSEIIDESLSRIADLCFGFESARMAGDGGGEDDGVDGDVAAEEE